MRFYKEVKKMVKLLLIALLVSTVEASESSDSEEYYSQKHEELIGILNGEEFLRMSEADRARIRSDLLQEFVRTSKLTGKQRNKNDQKAAEIKRLKEEIAKKEAEKKEEQ